MRESNNIVNTGCPTEWWRSGIVRRTAVPGVAGSIPYSDLVKLLWLKISFNLLTGLTQMELLLDQFSSSSTCLQAIVVSQWNPGEQTKIYLKVLQLDWAIHIK